MIHTKSRRTPCTRLMSRVKSKKESNTVKLVLEEREYHDLN